MPSPIAAVLAFLLLQEAPLQEAGGARDLTAAFDVAEGLSVALWAESPRLYNPTAIDVDERGRVWVVEAVNYRAWDGRNPGRRHPEGDRVVVLEDTDQDGVCDASHVFVQDPDLVAPLGIAVIAGKVYVSCSPTLWVYEDVDGDGRADAREALLTGFGGRDHDHGLHSVVAGSDGKLYFAVGNAGPHVVTDRAGFTLRSGSIYREGGATLADNKPGLVSDDGRVWTGGLICRVEPDGTGLEVLAHNFRNPYEVALDAFDAMYTADNDDDGNGACRTTWVMPGGDYGFFSADGSRTWQADRRPGQDNWTAHWHQDDPGVMPAGTRNGPGGPTGCAVYEGELLARWIDGAVLNADAGARAVYAHVPREVGVGVELEKRDFLRPKPGREDFGARWFRPSDVCVGPDGAVYVADWYDPGVGGHFAGDAEAYGRILRIAPKGSDARAPVFDLETKEGRLAALLSPAIHVRETARRAIAARGLDMRPEVDPALAEIADPRRRWWLYRARGYGMSHVVEWSEGRMARAGIASLRRDLLAGRFDTVVPRALEVDPKDRYAVEAFGLAAEGFEPEVHAALASELGAQDPSDWDERFEALAWRLHAPAATPAFLARALDPDLPAAARRRAIDALAFTGTREAAEAVLSIARGGPKDLRDYAAWWIRSRDAGDWRAFGLAEALGRGELSRAAIAWTSGEVESGLVDVDVDVEGASTLWLVASDAGDGNACDWADWIAPRFEGGGRTTSLVELPWLSAEAEWGEVQVGRNCAGGPLIAGDVETSDGIGTHARSANAFAVPDGATRFRAQAGPDAQGVAQGCGTSIVFQVRLERPMPPVPLAAWERALLDDDAPARDRRNAAESLARDPSGALRLLQLAKEGRVPAALEPTIAAAIHANPDLGVRALASERFPRPGAPPDYPSIAELAALEGDAARGRALFLDRERTQCITCHAYTSGDTTLGGDVGPDLTRIGEKYDAAAMLDAILNPSAGIAFGYDTWLIETDAGTLHSGFVLADGETLILKDTRGERHVFPADDVAERTKQTLSTMPEGVALGLAPRELADLVAFLRAPPAPTALSAGGKVALGEPIALFDGTSLDAWTAHLPEGARLSDVWSVKDGVLACAGQPIGYLRTKERYTSFHLSLEWRFDPAKGAGNSGVLLRVQPEDKVWPRSIEAQLHSGDAGDVWNIDAFPLLAAPERTSGRRTERLAPSSEKPLGEWNRYDVWLVGPRLELYVNGVLQNAADWCAEMPGWIALQSEGAAIEFRDVVLRPIAE